MKTYKEITQCDLGADTLAEAIINLVEADKNLKLAKANIPNETAQWDAKDYYAQEQELWNMWANLVHDKIRFIGVKYVPVENIAPEYKPRVKQVIKDNCPGCGAPNISTKSSRVSEYACRSTEDKYIPDTFIGKCSMRWEDYVKSLKL